MFADKLYIWYDLNKRMHPWLGSGNAYHIWLSEVIMQQTRIEHGTAYYLKFLNRYPTVCEMSKADEGEILKLWEGLGYYTRARNMLHTARVVCKSFGGRFPDNMEELQQLKGIGKYTSAAILSFAYNKPHAVIDANVIRIISRLSGIFESANTPVGRKKFESLADKMLDKSNPAKYNQAIMDFGALVCTAQPKCEQCPFTNSCYAYKNGLTDSLPVKNKKSKKKIRYFNYLVLTDKKFVVVTKRNFKDIWFNLYQFPMHESSKQLSQKDLQKLSAFSEFNPGKNKFAIKSVVHSEQELTHQKIKATFCLVETEIDDVQGMEKVSSASIGNYAFPGIIRNYLKEISIFKS